MEVIGTPRGWLEVESPGRDLKTNMVTESIRISGEMGQICTFGAFTNASDANTTSPA